MAGLIEVVNDKAPWIARRQFQVTDSDLGNLRHVLTIPPGCSAVRLFAAVEYDATGAGAVKQYAYDDCVELALVPLGGLEPSADDAVAVAWLWGKSFDLSDEFADALQRSPRYVMGASGPASGWAVFARVGMKVDSTEITDTLTLHLRAVAAEGGDAPLAADVTADALMPPFVPSDAEEDYFPDAVKQPLKSSKLWVSKSVNLGSYAVGEAFYFTMAGGPWLSQMLYTTDRSFTATLFYKVLTVLAVFDGAAAATSGVRVQSDNLDVSNLQVELDRPIWRMLNSSGLTGNAFQIQFHARRAP